MYRAILFFCCLLLFNFFVLFYAFLCFFMPFYAFFVLFFMLFCAFLCLFMLFLLSVPIFGYITFADTCCETWIKSVSFCKVRKTIIIKSNVNHIKHRMIELENFLDCQYG